MCASNGDLGSGVKFAPPISTSGRVLLLSPGSAFSTRLLKVPPGTGERQAVKRASLVLALCVVLTITLTSAFAQDDWNGGAGDWGNKDNWSNGVPGGASDVTIYSGGNDRVKLDVNAGINSLTLGGLNNGTTSELTDGHVAQTLTISNGLTVGQTGYLYLTGGSTVTAGADSSNAGLIDLENASTLKITGNFDNSGTVQTGLSAGGGNTLNVTGTLTNE